MSRKPSIVGRLWNFCSRLSPLSPHRPKCVGIDEYGNKYMMKPPGKSGVYDIYIL